MFSPDLVCSVVGNTGDEHDENRKGGVTGSHSLHVYIWGGFSGVPVTGETNEEKPERLLVPIFFFIGVSRQTRVPVMTGTE